MVKADLLDEGQQLLEILVGLSWKADDERAPQGDPGDPGADLFDEPVDKALSPLRRIRRKQRSDACCSGSSMYLQIFGSSAMTSIISSLKWVGYA